MKENLNNPLFGILLSIATFKIGEFAYKKTKFILFNPFLIALTLSSLILIFFDIPISAYSKGGDIIQFFLAPATIALALPLFKQINLLKKNIVPILIGSFVGAIVSLLSIIFLGKLLNIDKSLILSFLPKSITTPLGLELSQMLNAVQSITVFSIVITGISGSVFGPSLLKILHIKDPIAKGMGLGVGSHVFGTNRALEMGETEGAIAALSLVITGLITIIIAPLLKILI